MHGSEYRYIYMEAWETNILFGYVKNELQEKKKSGVLDTEML